mgnify:CR=1 FL=1
MVDVDRWILELCSLALRGGYYRSRIKIEEILHKFVEMLRPYSVRSEHVRRKIPLIESHDHTGTAADGRSQDMAVVGIG